MGMEGQQFSLEQAGMNRGTHANSDVGFAHGEIEFPVVDHQADRDVRVMLEKFMDARRDPGRAEAHGRGHPDVAHRLLGGIAEGGPGDRQFARHVLGGMEQHLTLFGQDESARVAVEEGHAEFLFQRADLAADRRLAEIKDPAAAREAAGFGDGVKDTEAIPVH